MIVLCAALLLAVPLPTGLAPTGSKPPGVLWYGYSVRTGAADIRVDDVAQVAPPNSRTTRYTSAIAHGGALSRVEVALGTPQGSVVYYDDSPPAHVSAGLFNPSLRSVPQLPALVDFPQGYVQPYGADGPPVPTQRFIGQVDHSREPLPVSSLGPRVAARALPANPVVPTGIVSGLEQQQQQPLTAFVRTQPVLQSLPPALERRPPLSDVVAQQSLPKRPYVNNNKAAVISLVVQPRSHPALGADNLSYQEADAAVLVSPTGPRSLAPAVLPPAAVVHRTGPPVGVVPKPVDGDELESSGALPAIDIPETVPIQDEEKPELYDGGKQQSLSTVASVGLQTSQSQDTTSVVKNHVKTPLVLNDGRGQYDFRGYKQFAGHSGASDIAEAPEDSRTSKKHRHNFRVS
ncbi:uncharacterized protein LOC144121848 [Amblyomma americanum]